MSENRILVIGATSSVGRQVVDQLILAGAPVRAMLRKPESADLPKEAEKAAGDLTRPETLDRCLDSIDSVFLIWTAPADTIASVVQTIARRAQRLVLLTSPHKTPHPFFQQPNALRLMHTQIEQTIEASGIEWTFLRPGMFAANTVAWWAEKIRAGENVIRWPYASAPTAPIHEHDIAAVGVRALLEKGHAGAEYMITGPESMTQAEQVATIGRVIGRPLRMEDISPDEARRELLSVIPALPPINMLLGAWAAAVGQPAWVTNTVAEVTGAPSRTYLQWATDHAADFRTSALDDAAPYHD
jgi:uncharacterized protein YbjT (DUF2867 family)